MLSAAGMQRQIQATTVQTAQAEGLAESGVNLAMYYLQNRSEAPGYAPGDAQWYWPGTGPNDVAFAGAAAAGTVRVEVTRVDPDRSEYLVESTGRPAGTTGSGIARTATARVYVNRHDASNFAALFDKSAVVPQMAVVGLDTGGATSTGDIYGNAAVKLTLGALVYGDVYSAQDVGSALPALGFLFKDPPTPAPVVPLSMAELPDYTNYAASGAGGAQAATKLPVTSLTHQWGLDNGYGAVTGGLDAGNAGYTLGPTPGNAAGVYVVDGNLALAANVEIEGTLIVRGNLLVRGGGIRIRHRPGMPALIVGGNLDMSGVGSRELTMRGLVWVGGRVFGSLTTTGQFNLDGTLMVAGSSPLYSTSPLANVRLRALPDEGAVAGITDMAPTVKVLQWR
jgi:hypothetical protein